VTLVAMLRRLPSGRHKSGPVRPTVTMIVSHLAPPYGLESVALSTLQLLREEFHVTVVCIGGSKPDLDLCPDAVLRGGPLRGVQRLRSIWRLSRYSKKLESDLILLAGTWVALPWLLVAGRKARRSIVWEHSLLRAKFKTARQLRLLALGAKFLYPRARTVVAVSEPLRIDVSSIAPGADVVTIPNLLTSGNITYALPERKNDRAESISLLTVGSLTSLKAQHLLIQALALVNDKITLSVVGTGPQLSKLVDLAARLKVSSRVKFEGFLSIEEVHERMTHADLLIHCAIAETFGLVYVEAAEANLPVIATQNAAAEAMIPAFVPGWICDANPSALAEGISRYAYESIPDGVKTRAAENRRSSFGPDAVLSNWLKVLRTDSRQHSDSRDRTDEEIR
jgi:glycosyltransferase involved in cell wall biosynthesis